MCFPIKPGHFLLAPFGDPPGGWTGVHRAPFESSSEQTPRHVPKPPANLPHMSPKPPQSIAEKYKKNI